MHHFTNVTDIGPLDLAVKEALEIKANRFGFKELGRDKTLMMIFFNSSLRTRLSTQKAAMNLGMNVIVLDVTMSMEARNRTRRNHVRRQAEHSSRAIR